MKNNTAASKQAAKKPASREDPRVRAMRLAPPETESISKAEDAEIAAGLADYRAGRVRDGFSASTQGKK
jgi:predicted transcriptional regulator